MIKRIICLGILAIMCLGILSGCSGIWYNEEFYDYDLPNHKAEAKREIERIANEMKQFYSEDNWAIVREIVEMYKEAIDEASDELQVNREVNNASGEIKSLEKKPMDGAEEYTEGSGTEDNPFIISNRGQLIHFSNQINIGEHKKAHFALGADIDLENMEWMPIGSYYIGFNGVFDGKGYEISNFNINRETRSYNNWGLFGHLTGNILNLGVTNFEINVRSLDVNVGGLVGYLEGGSITNCYSIGKIEATSRGRLVQNATPTSVCAGGLAGFSNEANISNCYSTCDIVSENFDYASSNHTSGLVGAINGSMENCYATGDVSVGHEDEADIFGRNSDLSNCYGYEGQKIDYIYSYSHYFYTNICSTEELNDPIFYTEKLGWSLDIWDLENLDFADGKYIDGKHPKLKKNLE